MSIKSWAWASVSVDREVHSAGCILESIHPKMIATFHYHAKKRKAEGTQGVWCILLELWWWWISGTYSYHIHFSYGFFMYFFSLSSLSSSQSSPFKKLSACFSCLFFLNKLQLSAISGTMFVCQDELTLSLVVLLRALHTSLWLPAVATLIQSHPQELSVTELQAILFSAIPACFLLESFHQG